MNWVELRKKSRMTQWLVANSTGISRMRISLAETGQVWLTPDEEAAVCKAVNDFILSKSQEFGRLLQTPPPSAGAEQLEECRTAKSGG
jgi:DNA-binding XRE family transcriptional regulator